MNDQREAPADPAGQRLADHVAFLNRVEKGRILWFVGGKTPHRKVMNQPI